jgi:hypothetical protein
MKTYVISAGLFVICTAMSGAQAPNREPTAPEKAQLFARNYLLIEKLIDSNLKLAKVTDSLERSESFRGSIIVLEEQIKSAVEKGDNARVAELSKHLNSLLKDGMLPRLGEARQQVSQNHPDESRLFKLRNMTSRMSEDLKKLTEDSRISDSKEAKELLDMLKKAESMLEEKMTLPEKK